MTVTRKNQPTPFEATCQDLVHILDEFKKACQRKATYWHLNHYEVDDLVQESIKKTLEAVKNNQLNLQGVALLKYLNSACRSVRFSMYEKKYYNKNMKRNEVSVNQLFKDSDISLEAFCYQIESHPLNYFIFQKTQEIIERVLARKKAKVRQIWQLHSTTSLQNVEIARDLQCNQNMVNSALMRLRDEIKAALKDEEIDVDNFDVEMNDCCPRNGFVVNSGLKVYLEQKADRKARKRKQVEGGAAVSG